MDGGVLFPGLPDDVALACIARVPRFFRSTLAQVSKPWRSLLQSPVFFFTRRTLNIQQEYLYIMLRTHTSSYKWYVLQEHCSQKKVCVPLPPMPSQPVGAACTVSEGKIFLMGGSVNDVASSTVWVYNSHHNRWGAAPRMRVRREFAAAGAIDGKIYVLGGCQPSTWAGSTSWAEVYDPCSEVWSSISSPPEMREKWMHGNAVLEGKLLAVADRGGVVFDPVTSSWDNVSKRLDIGWKGRAAVVDGVLFSYDFLGKIKGYDPRQDRWLELQGVQKYLPKFLSGATLANVAGRLYVVWEGQGSNKETDLLCAALEVDREPNGGLRGTILWSQVILSFPRGSSTVQCLSLGL